MGGCKVLAVAVLSTIRRVEGVNRRKARCDVKGAQRPEILRLYT